jgi:hypothetical protein
MGDRKSDTHDREGPAASLPPHTPILGVTTGAVQAFALRAVTDLLGRLLKSLAGAGYFRTTADGFELTPLGETPATGHPTAARDLVLTVVGPLFAQGLLQLPEPLRTGPTGAGLASG